MYDDLRFRDKRRKVLLGHMMKALRAGHDRAQLILLRQWLKISKKLKRDENMKKEGLRKRWLAKWQKNR